MPFVLAYLMTQTRAKQKRTIEPTAEAEQAYVEEVNEHSTAGSRFYAECTPGYYNSEGGQGNECGFFSDAHGMPPIEFFAKLAAWREQGNLEGISLA